MTGQPLEFLSPESPPSEGQASQSRLSNRSTAPADWSAWLPDWGRSVVIVLESGTELSCCLGTELHLRQKQCEVRGESCPVQLPECVSVSTVARAMQLIENRSVDALVLNLESHCRESLVLMRQKLKVTVSGPVAAVGNVSHSELRGILLEAGCSLLVTDLPADVPVANWLWKVLEHRFSREESGKSQKTR
ncbi:MAG: hypothetical protein JNL58_01340 [Planctomyces sp.]|nr:hypothetical protein [Planctomyces sp.]